MPSSACKSASAAGDPGFLRSLAVAVASALVGTEVVQAVTIACGGVALGLPLSCPRRRQVTGITRVRRARLDKVSLPVYYVSERSHPRRDADSGRNRHLHIVIRGHPGRVRSLRPLDGGVCVATPDVVGMGARNR